MHAWISVAVSVSVCTCLYTFWKKRKASQRFSDIPGPKGIPVLGNALDMGAGKARYVFKKWGKLHGPVFKVNLFGSYIVVVTGRQGLSEASVTRAARASGRPTSFRMTYVFTDRGFHRTDPHPQWKLVRKIGHGHMKQFGEGLDHIEKVACDISGDMYAVFSKAAQSVQALDPMPALESLAMKIVAYIMCGDRINDSDALFQNVIKYEHLFFEVLTNSSLAYAMLDWLPFLIHLPLKSSKKLRETLATGHEIEREVLDRSRDASQHDSLVGRLMQHVNTSDSSDDGAGGDVQLLKEDALRACLGLLGAGTGTTSHTMYCLINLMAHYPELQEDIVREIETLGLSEDTNVSLHHRDAMPLSGQSDSSGML